MYHATVHTEEHAILFNIDFKIIFLMAILLSSIGSAPRFSVAE